MTLRGQWSLWGAGAERGGLDAVEETGEGDVVKLGGLCPVRGGSHPAQLRARAASSLSNNQQAMVYRHTQLGNIITHGHAVRCTCTTRRRTAPAAALSTVHNRRFPFGSLEVISVCTQACSLDLHRSPDISITSPHVLCLCRGWPA